jgi:hypothetical protein
VGAYDEDGVRFSQPRRKLQHKIHHRLVAGIAENRQGAPTVGEIDNLGLILRIFSIRHEKFSIALFRHFYSPQYNAVPVVLGGLLQIRMQVPNDDPGSPVTDYPLYE